MGKKAKIAEGVDSQGAQPLPIGVTLSVRVPLADLPEDVQSALCEEQEEVNGEDMDSGTAWCTGKVVRSRQEEGGLQTRLRLPGGTEFWANVHGSAFMLHPPSKEEEQEDDPFADDDDKEGATEKGGGDERTATLRGFMAAQLSAAAPVEPVPHPDEENAVNLGEHRQQLLWKQELLGAASAGELAGFVKRNAQRMDTMNVAIATHRLAKNFPFGEKEAPNAWRAVRTCVSRAANDRIVGYSNQGLANICWALARMEVSVPLYGRSAFVQDSTSESASHPELAQDAAIVFRLAMAKFRSDIRWSATASWEEIAAWTWDWCGEGIWGNWSPMGTSSFVWALRKVAGPQAGEGEAGAILSLVAQGLVISAWKGFNPTGLRMTLHALITSGQAPPLLLRKVLNKVRRNRDMFETRTLCQFLCDIMGSVPTAQIKPEVLAVVTAAEEAELSGYSESLLADVARLIAKFCTKIEAVERRKAGKGRGAGCLKPFLPFVKAVTAHALEKDTWELGDLSKLVDSFAFLRMADAKLLDRVRRLWQTRLEEGATTTAAGAQKDAFPLAVVAAGLARLGNPDVALAGSACSALREALKNQEASLPFSLVPRLLAGLACAVATPGAEEEALQAFAGKMRALLRTLLAQSKKKGQDMTSPSQMATLHSVYACLRLLEGEGGQWQPTEAVSQAWQEAYVAKRAENGALREEAADLLEKSALLTELFPKGAKLEQGATVEGGLFVDLLIRPKAGKPVAIAFMPPELLLRSGKKQEPQPGGAWRFTEWMLQKSLGAAPILLSEEEWQASEAKMDLLQSALEAACKTPGDEGGTEERPKKKRKAAAKE